MKKEKINLDDVFIILVLYNLDYKEKDDKNN